MISLGEKFIRKHCNLSNSAPLSRELRERVERFDRAFQMSYSNLQWFDTEKEALDYFKKNEGHAWNLVEGPKELMKKPYCVDSGKSDMDVLQNLGGFDQVAAYLPREHEIKWFNDADI